MSNRRPLDLKQVYEARWTCLHVAINAAVARGERDLSRLSFAAQSSAPGWIPPADLMGPLVGLPEDGLSLAAVRFGRDWIADTVVELSQGCDAVIELGSGWGANLFNVWTRGGPDVPYHALEYTEAGSRACKSILAAASVAPRLQTGTVDFTALDLSALAGRYERPFLFTCAALDKVEQLPERCIVEMLSISPGVVGLHLESIGRQFAAEVGLEVELEPLERRSFAPNQNLLALLRTAEREGRLTIDETRARVLTRTSYVRWTRRSA